ncbi:MAG TPA: ABC transporter permease [archaeon]|nr:ABC transporter permease [archaeon]
MKNEFFSRSYSQAYKNFKLLFKNPFRWFDVTFWPLILFFSITIFASYLETDPRILAVVIMGLIGWRAVYHPLMEINTLYMEEYWSNSLGHFFITPIKPIEIVLGGTISALMKFFIVFIMYYLIAVFLYGFSFANFPVFMAAIFFLFLFGISIGMLILGLMFKMASDSFSLSYTVPDIAVLISGVYYPISFLPLPVQAIALLLPSAHAFNLIKASLGLAEFSWVALIITTIAWLLGTYLFMQWAFRSAKKSGKLVRVM